jgi:hypothetical protein
MSCNGPLLRFLAALLLGAAVGCGPGEGDDAGTPAPGGASVVLGTGREKFEALDSEGSVPLIKGIQGGFHVWTSFLAYGFTPDVLEMNLTTRWDMIDESVLEMHGTVAVKPVTDATGNMAYAMLGWPASIFNPACSNGQGVQLDLTITDMDGHSASDSRRWIVDVSEEDRSTDCAN